MILLEKAGKLLRALEQSSRSVDMLLSFYFLRQEMGDSILVGKANDDGGKM